MSIAMVNPSLLSLRDAYKSMLNTYNSVLQETCDRTSVLSTPMSIHSILDLADWHRQEEAAYRRYAKSRERLLAHLRTAS
jgi:hypothetical protein